MGVEKSKGMDLFLVHTIYGQWAVDAKYRVGDLVVHRPVVHGMREAKRGWVISHKCGIRVFLLPSDMPFMVAKKLARRLSELDWRVHSESGDPRSYRVVCPDTKERAMVIYNEYAKEYDS